MAGQTGDRLQSTPAGTCMKILLTVFNFIFLISGLAILAIGIWTKLELHIYVEFTENYYESTPYVLIGVGAGIVLIGSLGCMCTVKGKSALLYVYAAFLVLIFVAELGVAVAAFYYKGKLEKGFELGLRNAINNYNRHKKSIDDLQTGVGCCGADAYTDWFTVDWSGHGVSDTVPDSCCKEISTGCGQHPRNSTIYVNGCARTVTGFMETNFSLIGGVAIGFAFLQLFGAMLACCLGRNINKSKYEQMA